MPTAHLTDMELLAWLDEILPPERMSAVEHQLRNSDALRRRVAALRQRRDHGVHSVGEIWRRERISCPDRSQLSGYLLGTLEGTFNRYIEFHLDTIGCRFCHANLDDLRRAHADQSEAPVRRHRYFQSSAGYLKDRGA